MAQAPPARGPVESSGERAAEVRAIRVALNVAWTLLAGFLVVILKAGFSLVETGLIRAKNVAHTMAMNFGIFAIGMLGFWAVGFALMFGGHGPFSTFDGPECARRDGLDLPLRQALEPDRRQRVLPGRDGGRGDGPHRVPVPGGDARHGGDDPDRRDGRAVEVRGLRGLWLHRLDLDLSDLRLLGLGRHGWLANLGVNFGLGNGHVDFAGSSVVHMTGGMMALAGAIVLGPEDRQVQQGRLGQRDPRP